MNTTIARFNYPDALIREYRHWVVLIRPAQPTPLSCVIAARSEVTSLGALGKDAGAELPEVIRDYEAAVRSVLPAQKFNYLALMMVDPNPHFHAIPRYADTVRLMGVDYRDAAFPKPIDVLAGLEITVDVLANWRNLLAARWASPDSGERSG